uniref:Secreted protein n=1 Tax=Rhipicephalus microplus TaxID=6941 RepID=A0A6M2DA82_RHIMP
MLLSLQMLFLCAPLVAPIILLNETQHYPNRYSHYVFEHQCVPNTHFTSATTLFFFFFVFEKQTNARPRFYALDHNCPASKIQRHFTCDNSY